MTDDAHAPELEQLDDISRKNAIVQRMIRDNLAFTRDTYIRLRWPEAPTPWTVDHEKKLPPVFREPNAERVGEALKGLGDAIGVTYTGELPR